MKSAGSELNILGCARKYMQTYARTLKIRALPLSGATLPALPCLFQFILSQFGFPLPEKPLPRDLLV